MRRVAVAALAFGLAACITLSTDPHEIVAIEFAPLPWPSVVAGDTLRDASGQATPLIARLFDASGDEVTGQTLDFISRDTTVTIGSGNFLVAHSSAITGTARLLASSVGLQSGVRQVELVPRPDSLAASGTIDTLRLLLPDSPTQNISAPLSAKVISIENGTASPVRAWIVGFTLSYRGTTVAPGDTTSAYLVDDAGRPSYADTADVQGTVSRKVRFKTSGAIPALDSVIVVATASYRGHALAGSPLRLVLPIKPHS